MELLSRNMQRFHEDINLEMPQLLNRGAASNKSFNQVGNMTSVGQQVNFSITEEELMPAEAAPVPSTSAMDNEFAKNLANGKYVAELEDAIARRPMNIFGNGQGLQGAVDTTGCDPEQHVVLKNEQTSEKTEIAGPRSVVPVVPGMTVAGIDPVPVTAPEEALPESRVQTTTVANPVYPEETVVNQDTVVADPVSIQNVATAEQMFDQMETQRMQEIEDYKSFMNSVM